MWEIKKLHEMLTEAGIEHEFIDRGRGEYYGEFIDWGYQICVYCPGGEQLISVIEGFGTIGYKFDLLEIMGCLTPEEEENVVVGWLSAEEVFGRIKNELV